MYAVMITAHRALSTRRRGSSSDGKNDPTRTLGIRSSTSPAGVDNRRVLDPLRWLMRASVRSWGSAPITAVSSASIRSCIPCSSSRRNRSRLSPSPRRANRSATRASSSRVIAWFSSVSRLVVLTKGHAMAHPHRWTPSLPTPPHGTPTAGRARRMFGGLPVPGGVSDEHRGPPTSEASAAVVRAHGLARSSSALPTQWRSLLVDHVEQARLGCATSHDHRTEVRARAQRHHRLPRRWPKPRLDRDERLGRGSSLVVAQPRGTPRRHCSTDRPASAPGARAPGRGARA